MASHAFVPDALTALLGALQSASPAAVTFEEVRSRQWASKTFSGSRHELVLQTDENTAARLIPLLQAHALPMRGHLLADIALVSDERGNGRARLRLDALTLED